MGRPEQAGAPHRQMCRAPEPTPAHGAGSEQTESGIWWVSSRVYGGGPCDYCVSPSPKNWILGFFRLCLDLGPGLGTCWDRGWGLGLGLDNYVKKQINIFGFIFFVA